VPTSVPKARRVIVTFAAAHGFAQEDLEDIETAAGEALANAIEHGNRADGFIELFCQFTDLVLVVEVKDWGAGFLPGKSIGERSEGARGRGWGIFLMKSLMDRVSHRENGSLVRLEKRLPRAQRRQAQGHGPVRDLD
jgi:anti-sigma regulatory factor (Ser/Thr protein kinase)